jgi:hypothetical protein
MSDHGTNAGWHYAKRFYQQHPEKSPNWRKANPAKFKIIKRRADLKKKFSLTLEEYDDILQNQGGGCAICGGVDKGGRSLAVDHNHITGEIRGLLCTNCNRAVERLDNVENWCVKALTYLGGSK